MELLECYATFEALILAFPDDAHASAPYPAQEAVSIGNESLWFCHRTPLIRTVNGPFPAYGAESAPSKDLYPAVVHSIADDSLP